MERGEEEKKNGKSQGGQKTLLSSKCIKRWIRALWQQKRISQSSFISYSESRSSRGCAKCRDKWTSFDLGSLNNISAELFVTNVFALCCKNITTISSFWCLLITDMGCKKKEKEKRKKKNKAERFNKMLRLRNNNKKKRLSSRLFWKAGPN